MARETETYRDCMERLNELAPAKELFNTAEVARLIGLERRTVVRRFSMTNGYISKVNLARALSKMGSVRE